MSAAKKASDRASWASRGPSRQPTTRLVAGGSARPATARARSATTMPLAPSATPASVSGRPGCSSSAGDRAMPALPPRARAEGKGAQLPQQRRVEAGRDLPLADDPGKQLRVGDVDQPLELVELGL